MLPEDLDLLLEVFDRVLLIAVDPAGQTDEEQLKMVHPGRIGGGLQFGQEFCYGEAYTCVYRRILVSSKRKREFLDSTGRRGTEVIDVEVQPGVSRELPAWMTDEVACAGMSLGPAQVSVAALNELRAVLVLQISPPLQP